MNGIELKCRGKRLNGGEWVNGYYTHLDYNDRHFIADNNGNCYPVDSNTVGRYVGVKDINNRNVCEYDIVRLSDSVLRIFGIENPVGQVNYHKGIFYIGHERRLLDSVYTLTDYHYILRGEVIGNIFDNPDLLEETSHARKHEAN